MPKQQLFESWSDIDIIENGVENRIEQLLDDGVKEKDIDRNKIWEEIVEDSDHWQWEWDNLIENLSDEIKSRSPDGYWAVRVKNFGWKHLDGDKAFHAKDGAEFLREILPDADNQFKIYTVGNKRMAINNAHHDSPMWNEWYYLDPITEEEYDELRC